MDVLWINVAYISRLIKRFTLQTIKKIPEAVPLLRLVVPVTIVDELLKEKITGTLYDVDAASTGWKLVHTVPDGYVQDFRYFNIIRGSGATLTTDMMRVNCGGGEARIKGWTASSNEYVAMETPLELDEGDTISINVAAHGGTDKLTVYAYYLQQKSYE